MLSASNNNNIIKHVNTEVHTQVGTLVASEHTIVTHFITVSLLASEHPSSNPIVNRLMPTVTQSKHNVADEHYNPKTQPPPMIPDHASAGTLPCTDGALSATIGGKCHATWHSRIAVSVRCPEHSDRFHAQAAA